MRTSLPTVLATACMLAWGNASALVANAIPVINPIPPLTVSESAVLTHKVTATDADGDVVSLSATGLTSWMSFSGGVFTASPSATNSGVYTVKFIATDGKSNANATTTITVNNVNRAPTFGALTSKTLAEGGKLTPVVTATDPDGDVVTVKATGLKPWMTFDGKILTLQPTYTDSGSYSLTFTASDGNLATTASLLITVTGTNIAPVINAIPPLTVSEGGVLTHKVTATDADGDAVSLSATGLKSWMSFSGGVFTASPSATNSGVHTVKFIATDGKSNANATTTITVNNVNRAPTFGTLTSKTLAEGGKSTPIISATDPDGDVVTVKATGLKPWMTFDGKILTLQPTYNDSGSYSLTFTASDGNLATTASLLITVTGTNQAPIFGTTTPITTTEGATFSYNVIVSDADGDPVTLSATGLKSWMSFTGKTLSASPGYEDAGTYTVNLTASDGVKQTKGILTITVSASNRAPVISTIGNWGVGIGQVLSRPITATDAEGDPITFSVSGLQPWMSFDGRSFRARPGTDTAGVYSVTFVASDGGLSDTETLKVTVSANGGSFPPVWNQYLGSVGSGATWASWSRNSLFSTTGMGLVADPTGITDLVSNVSNLLKTGDVMMPTSGLTAGDENQDGVWYFMDFMKDGGAGEYQQAVRNQIEAMAPLDPSGKRIVYQLGNEIATFLLSDSVRQWAAGRGIVIPGVAMDYDPDYLPYYVEYQLAPTVEAMLEASATAYGDANKVTIALGSINNGGSAAGKVWLDLLLDYQVKGTYAPSLAGKRVYELVDLVTVHYVGGTGKIETIWDKWNGVGNIRGLWTTEEVGIRAATDGEGAGLAISKVADYLNWYYHRGLNQDQVGVSLYGWDVNGPIAGTSADTGVLAIFNFFGTSPLEPRTDVVTTDVTTDVSSGKLVSYQFQSLVDNGKRAIIVAIEGTGNTVNGISFDKQGWTGLVNATLHVFSPNGHSVSTVSVLDEGASYRVVLTQPIPLLEKGHAILITLQHP